MTPRRKLRIIRECETERTFGSRGFIARDRNPALPPTAWPIRRTEKAAGDVVI